MILCTAFSWSKIEMFVKRILYVYIWTVYFIGAGLVVGCSIGTVLHSNARWMDMMNTRIAWPDDVHIMFISHRRSC